MDTFCGRRLDEWDCVSDCPIVRSFRLSEERARKALEEERYMGFQAGRLTRQNLIDCARDYHGFTGIDPLPGVELGSVS